jgi:hypothetical protein
MNQKFLTCVLSIALVGTALGGSAMAQSASSTTTKTGIAKPPPGYAPPQPRRLNSTTGGGTLANTPTLPQIALRPTATVGSPVPVAGPGGSSRTPTGY